MTKYDSVGGYNYTPGYCIRDAFRQYFGDSPVLDWFPENCPWERVREFCDYYGYAYSIRADFSRPFRVGQAIVWQVSPHPTSPHSHAIFSRDPQRLADAQNAGILSINGYFILEE